MESHTDDQDPERNIFRQLVGDTDKEGKKQHDVNPTAVYETADNATGTAITKTTIGIGTIMPVPATSFATIGTTDSHSAHCIQRGTDPSP